jgi:hypothetical protein
MKTPTSDYALGASCALLLAGIFHAKLGLSEVWGDILSVSGGLFMLVTILSKRRELLAMDEATRRQQIIALFAASRLGVIVLGLAVVCFLVAMCFDLFKR